MSNGTSASHDGLVSTNRQDADALPAGLPWRAMERAAEVATFLAMAALMHAAGQMAQIDS
jgi:hypothetical protein